MHLVAQGEEEGLVDQHRHEVLDRTRAGDHVAALAAAASVPVSSTLISVFWTTSEMTSGFAEKPLKAVGELPSLRPISSNSGRRWAVMAVSNFGIETKTCVLAKPPPESQPATGAKSASFAGLSVVVSTIRLRPGVS